MQVAPDAPFSLTAQQQEQIVALIRNAGVYFTTACEIVGIRPELAQTWVSRGRGEHTALEPTPETQQFAEAVFKATHEAQGQSALRIRQAAQGGRKTTQTRTEEVYAMKNGQHVLVSRRVVKMEKEEPPDVNADMWWLERTDPTHWGRRDQTQIDVNILDRIAEVPTEAESIEAWAKDYEKVAALTQVGRSATTEDG